MKDDAPETTTDALRVEREVTPDELAESSSLPLPGAADSSSPEIAGQVLEDGDNLSRISSGPPYSVFSHNVKIWITVMVSMASFVSPTTANIYFPALNPIKKDLHVSTSLINLTLTTYIVLQGLAPTFFGEFGDMAGRRPAYILGFTIYLFANIGLALQRSYPALLVLRCVQSAGSSGTLALGYAMIADISSTSERGRYMGYVGAGVNVGPALGPVIGGLLSQYLGWPSIFWFCAIYVAVWLVPWILAVPETSRSVVGNGSTPPQPWNYTILDLLERRKLARQPEEEAPTRLKLRFPNPLSTLVIIYDKENALILLTCSIIYLSFIIIAATLSTLFQEIYGFNELEIGLCYLPFGFGSCVAIVAQGYVLDWNYRRLAKKLGLPVSRRRGDDLSKFPIESARLQPIYPGLFPGVAAIIGYGWALKAEASVAVPLVLLFITGLCVPSAFNVLTTLVIDLNPDAPATATAAMNLTRCTFGAVATAVVNYMLKGMGRGWCFTFLALLVVSCLPVFKLIEIRGPRWRAEKKQRLEARSIQTGASEEKR